LAKATRAIKVIEATREIEEKRATRETKAILVHKAQLATE